MNNAYLFLALIPLAIHSMENPSENLSENLSLENIKKTVVLDKKAQNRLKILNDHINRKSDIKIIESEETSHSTNNTSHNSDYLKKQLNDVISASSRTNRIDDTKLFYIINNMTFEDIITLDPGCICSLIWEYIDLVDRSQNNLADKDPRNKLFIALASRINYFSLSPKNITDLHPFILRAIVLIAHDEKNSDCLKHIKSCITKDNIALCDDQFLELLYKDDEKIKNEFVNLINEKGVWSVPHFMVQHIYYLNSEGKNWITEKIKKSAVIHKERSVLEYFLINPLYALRWIKNIKLLDNAQEIFETMKLSQSAQHFVENLMLVSEDMGYCLLKLPGYRGQLYQAMKIAEKEELKGNIVFFHAQKKGWGYLQDCFKNLWNIYYNEKKSINDDYWFFRYNLPGTNLPFHKVSEIMNRTWHDSGFDFETHYMNYAIFGSTFPRGSSTSKYAKNNHDYASTNISVRQLFETFDWDDYYDIFSSEFKELEELFIKLSGSYGNLIVMSFTPSETKKLICTGKEYGYRSSKKIEGIETHDPVKIVHALKYNPKSIENNDSTSKKEILALDRVEFFACMTDGKEGEYLKEDGEGFLNPYNTRIRMYPVRSGNLKDYFEKLKQLFEKIKTKIELDKKNKAFEKQQEQPKVLQLLSKGFDRNRESKYHSYLEDCKRFNTYNELIKKHDRSKTLRIMSYNVHYWLEGERRYWCKHEKRWKGETYGLVSSNVDDILKNIKTTNPDVVCLQEVNWEKCQWNDYTVDELTQKFRSMGYDHGGSYGEDSTLSPGKYSEWDNKDVPFGTIIFSKYPLENIVKKEFKDPNETYNERRTFVGVTVQHNNQQIRIYNTHLDVWDESGKMRQSEVAELLEHIKNEDEDIDNVIIVGDFNETRERDYQYSINNKKAWDLIKEDDAKRNFPTPTFVEDGFEKAGYKDAYTVLPKKRPILTSWTGKIIDFGYLKPNGTAYFEDVNAYYDKSSDHTPIIFDIAFTAKEMNNEKTEIKEKKKTIFDEISKEITKEDKLEDQKSSVVCIAQKGYQQTGWDKQYRYMKDCARFKIFNELIPKHDASKMLRVMTYNIGGWQNNNFDEVFSIIKNLNPDVVCLQDVYFGKTVNNQWIPFYDIKAVENQTDELSEKFKQLGYKNDQSWFGKRGPNTFGYNKWVGTNDNRIPFGIVMFSKNECPLTDVTVKRFEKPKLHATNPVFAFVGARVNFNKKPVYICSTKLDPSNHENRQSEVLELIKHVNDKENVIICGDFNEPYKNNYSTSEWNALVKEDKKQRIQTTEHVEENFKKVNYKHGLELCNTKLPFTTWSGMVTDGCYLKEAKTGTLTIEKIYPYFSSISTHLPIIFDFSIKK